MPSGSPASSLLLGPPTSWLPSASAPVPLAFGLPLELVLVLGRDTQAPASALPLEIGYRLSVPPDLFHRGIARISQFTGSSLPCVPRSTTPPGVPAARPLPPLALLPSSVWGPSAPGIFSFRSRLRGPHARTPTHQRSGYPVRCKACFRPAGLSSGRAGLSPAGRRFRFCGSIVTSFYFRTSSDWSLPKLESREANRFPGPCPRGTRRVVYLA